MSLNKSKIIENILNKKEENLFSIATVVSVDPYTIKFPPDTTAIPAVSTTSLLNITINSRVICLRYGKQYLIVNVIGDVAGAQNQQVIELSAAETASNATLINSGLTFTFEASSKYHVWACLSATGDDADGIKIDWSETGTIPSNQVRKTMGQAFGQTDRTDTTVCTRQSYLSTDISYGCDSANTIYEDFILNTTTSGSLTMRFAKSVASSGTDITLTSGSYLIVTKIGAGSTGSTSSHPIGSITQYAGSSAPSGWLLCNGSAVSRTTYADLFSIISTTYGVGDGSTTFNLPDMQGKVPVGYDSGDGDFDLGDTGGSKTHTLTSDEMPSHTHTQDSHNHTQDSHNHTQDSHNHTQDSHNHTQDSHNHTQDAHTHGVRYKTLTGLDGSYITLRRRDASDSYDGEDSDAAGSTIATNQSATATNQSATAANQSVTATNQSATATNQSATATNQNTGGGSSHNNLQPYVTVNYIIKT